MMYVLLLLVFLLLQDCCNLFDFLQELLQDHHLLQLEDLEDLVGPQRLFLNKDLTERQDRTTGSLHHVGERVHGCGLSDAVRPNEGDLGMRRPCTAH